MTVNPGDLSDKILQCLDRVGSVKPYLRTGRVEKVVGLTIESLGPNASVGEICRVYPAGIKEGFSQMEAVGFRDGRVLLMPLGDMTGVSAGATVVGTGSVLKVSVGPGLLGRVLGGLGNPIDNKGSIPSGAEYPVEGFPPPALERPRITTPLSTGVRAIDTLLTCGRGQRIGIMAGSGVGKSTLLGMIARNTDADVNVVALIGERGREVREFLEKDLGAEGLSRSVVVVATSDQPALVRIKAAHVAHAIAEYFRDSGKDVLLMMDSVTRLAMAQREVGLATGEPPATRGYTPSVFSLLPRLLERSGTSPKGTITGFYTVLMDGDDIDEPVTDTIRGVLDGHVLLSRELATANHYPAIDILGSVSRLMVDLASERHKAVAARVRQVLGTYYQARDLVSIGAYQKGTDPETDFALKYIDKVNGFLTQGIADSPGFDESLALLEDLLPLSGNTGGDN